MPSLGCDSTTVVVAARNSSAAIPLGIGTKTGMTRHVKNLNHASDCSTGFIAPSSFVHVGMRLFLGVTQTSGIDTQAILEAILAITAKTTTKQPPTLNPNYYAVIVIITWDVKILLTIVTIIGMSQTHVVILQV